MMAKTSVLRLSPRTKALLIFAGAGVLVLLLPFVPPFDVNFRITQLQVAASLTIIVLGLNLLTGYSGQISLGHSGFALAGAYTTGILLEKGVLGQTVHPVLAVLAATAVSGVAGVALGVPALRLRGPYLAIVTLGFALVVPVLLKWSTLFDLTGGSQGIVVGQPHVPDFLGFDLSPARWRYYIIALPALGLAFIAWNLTRSRFGRALVAIREDELAAEQMGVNVAFYKAAAFGISAAYAGTGGALFVYASLGVVTPDTFGLLDSIGYLTAIVVGGLATITGSVMGALFLAYQAEIVRFLLGDTWDFGLFSIPSVFRWVDEPELLRWAVYGTILITVMLVAPYGLVGLLARLAKWRPWSEVSRIRAAGSASRYLSERLTDPVWDWLRRRRLSYARNRRSRSLPRRVE